MDVPEEDEGPQFASAGSEGAGTHDAQQHDDDDRKFHEQDPVQEVRVDETFLERCMGEMYRSCWMSHRTVGQAGEARPTVQDSFSKPPSR